MRTHTNTHKRTGFSALFATLKHSWRAQNDIRCVKPVTLYELVFVHPNRLLATGKAHFSEKYLLNIIGV